jgi:hypothetical protein
VKRVLAATVIAYAALVAGCTSGDRSVNLDGLRNADAPYYYVGSSFDGYDVSYVARYRAGMASIIYGTCHAGSDGGCPPPLEIQHRLCFGVVTISIFVGQGAKSGSAPRFGRCRRGPGPERRNRMLFSTGASLAEGHSARVTLPNAGPGAHAGQSTKARLLVGASWAPAGRRRRPRA